MSQTQGELSGARPAQVYSACEQSLTHITLGSGPSAEDNNPSQQHPLFHRAPEQPQYLHHHQHQHHQQAQQDQHPQHYFRPPARYPDSVQAGSTAGLQQLPSGAGSFLFESRSALGAQPSAQQQQQAPHAQHAEHRFGNGGGGTGPAPSAVGGGGAADSPQDLFCPPQVYDNSMMLKEQGISVGAVGIDPDDLVNDENEDREGGELEDAGEGNSQGSGKRSRTRRPHLQGRFSGRLTTKEDERRLAEECKLLGPLLGGVGKRGDKSRLTLAKIVRGIATGDVRRFCEERERGIAMLKTKLAAIDPEAAASVPINAIPLPSAGLGAMGSLSCGVSLGPMSGLGGPMSMGGSGSMGGPGGSLSLGVHGPQLEKLQRENSELRNEVYGLRLELQARERLLLELQDTGIISGFVPTSIPLDDPQHLISHPGALGAAPSGQLGPGPAAHRGAHSADMAPAYSLPQRHHSYGAQPMGSYGGPSQMSMPQSSAHVSSGMEPGPLPAGGSVGTGAVGFGQQAAAAAAAGAGLQLGGGAGGSGNGPWVGESSGLAVMPAMSEHSRHSRPLKRPAVPELGGGGGSGSAYGEVPRSLSHPPLGRAGGGGGGGGGATYPHLDLQQQLNSLQAQVEQLQNMSQAQVGGRGAASFLMPARERSGTQFRMGGMAGGAGAGGGGGSSGQMHYGGGAGAGSGGISPSPFLSSNNSGPQGGLLMLPTPQPQSSDTSAHPFQAHPAIGGPLHLQVIKQSGLYDDGGGAGGGGAGRDPREPAGSVRHGGGGNGPAGGGGGGGVLHDGDVGYGGGGAGGIDAALEQIMNSRAMRGEYDLPLELLLSEGVKGGGGGGGLSGPH